MYFCHINPYKPGTLFVGHRQTERAQIVASDQFPLIAYRMFN